MKLIYFSAIGWQLNDYEKNYVFNSVCFSLDSFEFFTFILKFVFYFSLQKNYFDQSFSSSFQFLFTEITLVSVL